MFRGQHAEVSFSERLLSAAGGHVVGTPTESQGRIVGGAEVDPARYPYLVSIHDDEDGSNQLQYKCTGVLIHPRFCITAAHCEGSAKVVSVGRHDITGTSSLMTSNGDYELHRVVQKHVHPGWRGVEKAYNDLMVLELSDRSNFPPVTLNTDPDVPLWNGQSLTVIGWGTLEKDVLVHSPHPHETEMEYVNNQWCQELYGRRETISDDMMCAKDESSDACLGDSGGPLIMRGNHPGEDVLVGVVSWGYSCVHPVYPGVFSRITHSLEWIESVLAKSDQPTASPSTSPTTAPTKWPSKTPTMSPSPWPTTAAPTKLPSKIPTKMPSPLPTTIAPTKLPSNIPTMEPSPWPTTTAPTKWPSKVPTMNPSPWPTTTAPTKWPSKVPTMKPSPWPTTAPPTQLPTQTPQTDESIRPPSMAPTTAPPSPHPTMLATVRATDFRTSDFRNKTGKEMKAFAKAESTHSSQPPRYRGSHDFMNGFQIVVVTVALLYNTL